MRGPGIVDGPGTVDAVVVSDELLTAIDWLPRLAFLVGESGRVPTDRPIDALDASAFPSRAQPDYRWKSVWTASGCSDRWQSA
jgi:hypothetical protein